jgi:hypothetical protein
VITRKRGPLPSWLKYWKVDKDGNKITGTEGLVPFADVGTESVGAAQEEERLQKAGFKTQIIRGQHYAQREGGDILK